MRLDGKVIGILAGPGYEDLEFWVPCMRVQEEGAEVKVIGIKADQSYTSKSGGLTVECQVAANDISADQLDALVFRCRAVEREDGPEGPGEFERCEVQLHSTRFDL